METHIRIEEELRPESWERAYPCTVSRTQPAKAKVRTLPQGLSVFSITDGLKGEKTWILPTHPEECGVCVCV